MKHLLILTITLLFGKNVFSQETTTDLILTEKQNTEWIASFEKLSSKSDQIAQIKKKIFADTIYKRQKSYCRIVIKNQETIQDAMEKANCECKIVFVLGLKKNAYLLDPTEYPKTNRILELVTDKNVDKVTVLKGTNASALYGTNGRCGVVIMYSDSRKFKRKVKNVL
ncbi:hypothetical protein [Aquimarina sp. 2304DJ70-9]|uniref:hypothetical protein n=1 Tax=Aquimarina penaris TaxID=3231044 RepID=UPI003463064D